MASEVGRDPKSEPKEKVSRSTTVDYKGEIRNKKPNEGGKFDGDGMKSK